MAKILFFLALGLVLLYFIKKHTGSRPQAGQPPHRTDIEDMVKCAHCGVNLPRSEAIYSKGEFFCTPEHHQLQQK